MEIIYNVSGISEDKNLGFTLLELLISVALVALMTVGVVTLIGQSSRQYSRDAKRKSDLQSVASALELFRTDQGYYPSCVSSSNCAITNLSGVNPFPTYMLNIPTDPAGGNRVYRYFPQPASCAAGSCTGYRLCMGLEKIPNPTPPVLNGSCQADCDNVAGTTNCYEMISN